MEGRDEGFIVYVGVENIERDKKKGEECGKW